MLQTKPKIDYKYNQVNYKNKREKVNKKKISLKLMVGFSLILITLGVLLVAYIGQSVQLTHLNYELNYLRDELEVIEETNHKLNLQIARDRSLARIEQIARRELHMIEPEEMEVIVLNDHQTEIEAAGDRVAEEKFFLAALFDNILERLGTVKADSLD